MIFDQGMLPDDWAAEEAPAILAQYGDDWAAGAQSVALRIPGALSPLNITFCLIRFILQWLV